MADSKLCAPKDLTICGICLMVIEDPKALPCLHSYCLKCLSKWAEGQSDKIRCPICIQDFQIPTDGVSGFITNFFINTLKDRRDTVKRLQAKDAVIPCVSCGQSDHKAEAYCKECGGFICEECNQAHGRYLTFKNHNTIPFADLQSGKVDIRNLNKKQYCKEHEGQVRRFYCTTCGILICHECTVVEHPVSSHVLVSLKQITTEQREDINKLQKDCIEVKDKVDKAIKDIDVAYKRNEDNARIVREDLQKTVNELVATIQKKAKDLEDEISQAMAGNRKQIDAHKDTLLLQQTRLDTALQMAAELMNTGSDSDLALVHSSLKDNLVQLTGMNVAVEANKVQEIQFQPSHGALTAIQVGSVRGINRYAKPRGIGKWEFARQFANSGSGQITDGRGIAISPITGDIIAADFRSKKIKVFKGEFKQKIVLGDGSTVTPYNVIVNDDGIIFLACLNQSQIHVYQSDGTCQNKFTTISPDNISSNTQLTSHAGLAIDKQGNILVGETSRGYISKHRVDATHVSSFKVALNPHFLAVTMNDEIVVSTHGTGAGIQVLDKTGKLKHVIQPLPGIKWAPKAIYCTDVLYIANTSNPSDGGGIYCCSVTGENLQRVIKDSDTLSGVTLNQQEDKLFVTGTGGVKMYIRK